ncbi:MAG: hypothetical protein ABIM88_05950 [candidate division WOR-3 bacterium]
MLSALLALSVNISDTIPGSAEDNTKAKALSKVKRIADETGRISPSEHLAQSILAFTLDADSFRNIYDKASLEYMKEEPISCLFETFWSAMVEDTSKDKKEKDTTYTYAYTSEFRLIRVETGEILGGFRAEGTGFGDSYSAARSMAWAEWEQDVELGFREMFRVQGRITQLTGFWWNKKARLDIGKNQGVEEGHIYSVWKAYEGGAKRRVGLLEITETHPAWSKGKVLHGTYEVSEGDLLYEETRPRLWQGVVRVYPLSGYAYDRTRLVAPAKDIYLGVRPSVAYKPLAPEFGLEFTRHGSAWGLENWIMGVGRADLIPEYMGFLGDLGFGLFWHHQPISKEVILEGNPSGAETFGLGIRADAGIRLVFGEDFSVFGTLGWRGGIQTPWAYYYKPDSTDQSNESQRGWRSVPPEYLEDGDLRIFGPVISLGFAFKI